MKKSISSKNLKESNQPNNQTINPKSNERQSKFDQENKPVIRPKSHKSTINLGNKTNTNNDGLSIVSLFHAQDSNQLSNKETDSSNIKVVARFRPLNEVEVNLTKRGLGSVCVEFDDSSDKFVKLHNEHTKQSSLPVQLDKIFPSETPQETIYQEVGYSIIEDILDGYNGTVLAYGQSGSGKTFTMFGENIKDPQLKGIIPRNIDHLFHMISQASGTTYKITLSMLQIYKEVVYDLLTGNYNLKIKESPIEGIYVEGAEEICVDNPDTLLDLLEMGFNARVVSGTGLNQNSSRSHTLFLLEVVSTKDNLTRKGKLNLVDLSGSEKISKTEATGQQLEEAKKINLSLSVLGNVINNLAKQSNYIPYRDSKLTRILQESLGGNYKTTLVVTCSPHSYHYEETMSTLRFAQRAKTIKNHFKMNVRLSYEQLQIQLEKTKQEVFLLTGQNASLRRLLERCDDTILRDFELSEIKSINMEETKFNSFKQMKDQRKDTEESAKYKSTEVDELKEELFKARLQLDEKDNLLKTSNNDLLNQVIELYSKVSLLNLDKVFDATRKEYFLDFKGLNTDLVKLLKRSSKTRTESTANDLLDLFNSNREYFNYKDLDIEKELKRSDCNFSSLKIYMDIMVNYNRNILNQLKISHGQNLSLVRLLNELMSLNKECLLRLIYLTNNINREEPEQGDINEMSFVSARYEKPKKIKLNNLKNANFEKTIKGGNHIYTHRRNSSGRATPGVNNSCIRSSIPETLYLSPVKTRKRDHIAANKFSIKGDFVNQSAKDYNIPTEPEIDVRMMNRQLEEYNTNEYVNMLDDMKKNFDLYKELSLKAIEDSDVIKAEFFRISDMLSKSILTSSYKEICLSKQDSIEIPNRSSLFSLDSGNRKLIDRKHSQNITQKENPALNSNVSRSPILKKHSSVLNTVGQTSYPQQFYSPRIIHNSVELNDKFAQSAKEGFLKLGISKENPIKNISGKNSFKKSTTASKAINRNANPPKDEILKISLSGSNSPNVHSKAKITIIENQSHISDCELDTKDDNTKESKDFTFGNISSKRLSLEKKALRFELDRLNDESLQEDCNIAKEGTKKKKTKKPPLPLHGKSKDRFKSSNVLAHGLELPSSSDDDRLELEANIFNGLSSIIKTSQEPPNGRSCMKSASASKIDFTK